MCLIRKYQLTHVTLVTQWYLVFCLCNIIRYINFVLNTLENIEIIIHSELIQLYIKCTWIIRDFPRKDYNTTNNY